MFLDPSYNYLILWSLRKHLCTSHTFGDTFSGATAMPLFELPALAAQSIWPNG